MLSHLMLPTTPISEWRKQSVTQWRSWHWLWKLALIMAKDCDTRCHLQPARLCIKEEYLTAKKQENLLQANANGFDASVWRETLKPAWDTKVRQWFWHKIVSSDYNIWLWHQILTPVSDPSFWHKILTPDLDTVKYSDTLLRHENAFSVYARAA